jgi:hypothetical protein
MENLSESKRTILNDWIKSNERIQVKDVRYQLYISYYCYIVNKENKRNLMWIVN